MMKVLVVTGGIGSGKSAVCRILKDRWNLPVYDADSRVKSLYVSNPALLYGIEKALDCRFRDVNGCFIPSLLAEKIFNVAGALEKVEELVFPALKDDFLRFSETEGKGGTVVFESATILEKPQFDGFGDKIIFVDAPFDVRMRRACLRDGAKPEAVLARMNRQKLMNDLCGHADEESRIDVSIVNDGTEEELEQKVDYAMKVLFPDYMKTDI